MTVHLPDKQCRGAQPARLCPRPETWPFAGSDRGADRAAAIATLIATAKLNDVDPQAWLADALARIAGTRQSQLAELLPWHWRANTAQHRAAACSHIVLAQRRLPSARGARCILLGGVIGNSDSTGCSIVLAVQRSSNFGERFCEFVSSRASRCGSTMAAEKTHGAQMPNTASAIRMSKIGAPDVLQWTREELSAPGEGQLQIAQEAIGVNYIDVYHRVGSYPLPLPTGIGVEGAGTVAEVGPGVVGFGVGDRIVYAGGPPGAYATARNIPAARAVKLPDDITSKTAASLFFKGLTVEYLIRRCFEVQSQDFVLFHAAAGGVGLIASQWLKSVGATVIGTVGSEEKAKLATSNGCEHAILYTQENFVERVKEITGGSGVSVVYDSIGASTFAGSLDCLRARGTLVSFGTSSGPIPPLDLGLLGAKGSLYVTRPSIAHYTAKRDELEAAAAAVFSAIRSGVIKPASPTEYALAEAQKAHEDLEARKTAGSLLLIP